MPFFNEVPFFVDIFVLVALKLSIDHGRDKRKNVAIGKGKDDFLRVVGFYSEDVSGVSEFVPELHGKYFVMLHAGQFVSSYQ
jgi:hypothetical protein